MFCLDTEIGSIYKDNVLCSHLNFIEVLFFTLYMTLPSYFALEISQSFPLITARRAILILLLLTTLYKHKMRIKRIIMDRRIALYFLIIIFSDLIHLVDSGSFAIKDLLSNIFEQVLIFWLINVCVNTKAKFEKALKLIYYSSGCVAAISIIGFAFNVNPFYILNLVNRTMLMTANTDIGSRAGMMRIEAGFGHPIYYALYCTMMIFVGIYFVISKRTMANTICFVLNAAALFLTNSRGCILGCMVGGLISVLLSKKTILKKYLGFIVRVFFWGSIIILLLPPIRRYMILIIESISIYFGGSVNKTIGNYGANVSFLNDRLMQMTGFIWTFINKWLFGFGAEAQSRGLVFYFFDGIWWPTNSFDVGYVAIICQYGVFGLVGFILLYSTVFKKSKMKCFRNDMLIKFMRDAFIAYFICMLSSVSIDRIFWVMFSMMMAYCEIIKKESA